MRDYKINVCRRQQRKNGRGLPGLSIIHFCTPTVYKNKNKRIFMYNQMRKFLIGPFLFTVSTTK